MPRRFRTLWAHHKAEFGIGCAVLPFRRVLSSIGSKESVFLVVVAAGASERRRRRAFLFLVLAVPVRNACEDGRLNA